MNWKPISAMPAELRDGRQVLLLFHEHSHVDPVFVGRFSRGYWTCYGVGCCDECFTHYCEITKPEVRDGE